jgi:hypothetical protein
MKKARAALERDTNLASIAKAAASAVAKHIGDIGTAVAVGALFVPGVDIVDIALVTTIGLGSRVAQRSINDGASPWSAQNLGLNLADSIATVGSFGLVSASSLGAESVLSSMSRGAGNLLRVRLAFPDIFGFGLGLFRSPSSR